MLWLGTARPMNVPNLVPHSMQSDISSDSSATSGRRPCHTTPFLGPVLCPFPLNESNLLLKQLPRYPHLALRTISVTLEIAFRSLLRRRPASRSASEEIVGPSVLFAARLKLS